MFYQKQIYSFGKIQTRIIGGQPCSDTFPYEVIEWALIGSSTTDFSFFFQQFVQNKIGDFCSLSKGNVDHSGPASR